ncbi:hypothetical protein V8E36_008022 [Tilletia maclaganii]
MCAFGILPVICGNDAVSLILQGINRECSKWLKVSARNANDCSRPVPFTKEACEVVDHCKTSHLDTISMPRLQLSVMTAVLFELWSAGEARRTASRPRTHRRERGRRGRRILRAASSSG